VDMNDGYDKGIFKMCPLQSPHKTLCSIETVPVELCNQFRLGYSIVTSLQYVVCFTSLFDDKK